MTVQIAPQVLQLDQPGQRASLAGLDLPGVLAQLGWHPGQAQATIHLAFVAAGHLPARAAQAAGAPRVPAWSRWTAGLLARRRWLSVWRVSSLAVLSATRLVVMALRQPQGSGLLGERRLDLLDAGFGRRTGLAPASSQEASIRVGSIGAAL